MKTVLACDLGASSGRLVAQKFNGQKLELTELHRFTNKPLYENGHYYWDFEHLLREIHAGINKVDFQVASLGIDTWGVDFGLLSQTGALVSKPFSYRDTYTEPYVRKATTHIPAYELFQQTGNEIAAINTLFQLMAIQEHYPHYLEKTAQIVMTPNLFMHALSGVAMNEFTIASTSQLVNANKQWDKQIQHTLFHKQLPFAPIEMPHQIVGNLRVNPNIKMALVPGHDTACALSALPIQQADAIFMSIGTWGLIGKEVEAPITTMDAFQAGFTNEGTSEGHYRFQKNAMGFWILQKLREEWRQQGLHFTYEQELYEATKAVPFQTFIDPDDAVFFNPASMTEAVKNYCAKTNQQAPETPSALMRGFIESLALKYAHTIKQIEKITHASTTEIYIGGGGAQNALLCQSIANATQKSVFTGPAEASSIGNGLSQLRALGEIHTVTEARQLVANSFNRQEYEPQQISEWQAASEKFQLLLK